MHAVAPLFLALLAAAAPPAAAEAPLRVEPASIRPIPLHDAPPPAVETDQERVTASYEGAGSGASVSAQPLPYPFYPQGGNMWGDLPVPNYVDLDASPALLDWDCSAYTYNKHGGMDTPLAGFKTQSAGVPVFAALDGTVLDTHDGEIDTNTDTIDGVKANYVVLDHGNTQFTYYYHFKRNSVAVSPGETVVAGQQIGLTGSSGYSSWPHLHFGTRINGKVFEPFAGDCRPGESGWTRQVPIRRDPYVLDLAFSRSDFSGDRALPWDKAERTGAFLAGDRAVHLEIEGTSLPERAVLRFRFLRPDGATAADFVSETGWPFMTFYVVTYQFAVPLDAEGSWRLRIEVNGSPLAEAPFDVVASEEKISNRPPSAVTAAFDPPSPEDGAVLFCRVDGEPWGRDPDYELVSYRYRWTVDGAVVREVTSAGMADALRRDVVREGGTIECAVTPTDGVLDGPTASVRTTVGRSHGRPLAAP